MALEFSSVQFSWSVMSDSLQPHESQHARPPCPSPTPGVHSKSYPSSWWCHPATSASVVPFSSYPQSLLASESCPVSRPFASGGQTVGASASASVLPIVNAHSACSVQFSSVAQSCPTLCDPMNCSTPGFPVLHHLLELTQTHVHWVGMLSNDLILCCPFLLLPSIFPSIRVFSNESALRIRGPKYWSFSLIVSPSNEYSGLISCRIDYFDLLAGQGTLKSLLQHQVWKINASTK